MTTQTEQRVCQECGGRDGEMARFYLAPPDDGGDVLGRTPAGYYWTHAEQSSCAAETERHRLSKLTERERRLQAFAQWLEHGEATQVHADLPRVYFGQGDYGPPVEDPARPGIWSNANPYPLGTTYYRKTDRGWEELGEFQSVKCICGARSYSGQLAGWTKLGGQVSCPQHADVLVRQLAGYSDGTITDIETGAVIASKPR